MQSLSGQSYAQQKLRDIITKVQREEWIVGELAVLDTVIQLVNELDCGIWLESGRNGISTFIFLEKSLTVWNLDLRGLSHELWRSIRRQVQ